MSRFSVNTSRPLDAVELAIRDSMPDVAELVEADRILVFDYDFQNQTASATHEWCRDGVRSVIADCQGLSLLGAPDWDLSAHRRGGMIWWPDVPAMASGPGRDCFARGEVKSLMAVPTLDSGTCIGFIACAWVRQHRVPQAVDQRVLVMVSRLAASASRRKQAEVVSEASESRLRSIGKNFSEGMFYQILTKPGGIRQFTYLSDSVRQLYGISPEEAIADASRIYGRLHSEDADRLARAEAEAEARLATFRCEARVVNPSGGLRWSSFVSTPRRLEGGWVCWDGVEFIITERKKAEEALKESHQRARRLLDADCIGIIIADASGRVLETNDYFLRLAGYSRAEFEAGQLDWRALTPPEWLFVDERAIAEARTLGTSASYEKEYLRRDGTRVAIFVSLVILPGTVESLAAFVLDISERKRAERELQLELRLSALLAEIATAYIDLPLDAIESEISRSLEKMAELVEADRAYIFDYDFDRQTAQITHEWCRAGILPQAAHYQSVPLTAMPMAELHRRGELDYTPDVSLLSDDRRREMAERAGSKSRLTMPLMSAGECLGFVGFSWSQLHDAYSVRDLRLLTVFAHMLVSVRERKRAEQQLALLKHSIDLHPDAAYWTDVSGRFIYVNEAGFKVLGYRPEELLGKTVESVNPRATPERWQQVWKTLREQGVYRVEAVHRRKDGSEFPVEVIGSYTRFGGKEYNCGFVHDISERRRAEEEQRQVQARLNQAQKMEAIGTLAGGIAHDFNNILGAMIGYTDLALMELPDGSPVKSLLENVERGGARAVDLVRQILSFSRQTAQERKPIQPVLVIKEVMKLIRATLPATIALKDHCESSGWILADAGQVHQIVMNLCTNAGLAMRERGGVLDVRLGEIEGDAALVSRYPQLVQGRYVCLAVKDTGCGIPAENLARIFEPFFTTRPAGQGTGLGLSVVHGIVESWGGAIGVTSEVGAGTTFEILLPACAATAKVEIEQKIPNRGQERVLFVDDEIDLTEVARQGLQRFGYVVAAFNDPRKALEAFRARPGDFDIVVTDMTMPGLTGEVLAAEVRRLRPEIPIVLVSGFSDRFTAEQASAAGFDGFVDKPLRPTSLAQIIRTLCDRR